MRTLRSLFTATLALAMLGTLPATVVAQDDGTDPTFDQDTELLPGVELVTEQVEPGVFRVVSDGVRELSRPVELDDFYGWAPPGHLYRENALYGSDITANQDGVWLRRPEAIMRLGATEPVWTPDAKSTTPSFAVAPDGTLYRSGEQLILEEGEWAKMDLAVRKLGLRDVDRVRFAPDGSLWVLGNNGKKSAEREQRLARRDASGWSRIATPPNTPKWRQEQRKRESLGRRRRQPPRIDHWAITPDGTLYVTRGRDVQRFAGEGWETLERSGVDVQGIHIGPDGAVWVASRPGGGEWSDRQVVRVDAEGMPAIDIEWHPFFESSQGAGAGGAFWYAPNGDPMAAGGCGGITRVDGTTEATFLEGMCIYDIAIGPNGGVWLEAGTWDGNYWIPDAIGPVETFVITVDAEAATT